MMAVFSLLSFIRSFVGSNPGKSNTKREKKYWTMYGESLLLALTL